MSAVVERVKKLRKRRPKSDSSKDERPDRSKYTPYWAPGQPGYDPALPYGPHVYVARKSAPQSWWVFVLEVMIVISAVSLFTYAWFYVDHLHYHAVKAYAHMGSSDAQHVLAHKYLDGTGVQKDEDRAMHWFKQAAERGHPDASYNVVSGHMQGYNVDLQEHEIEKYLVTAHEAGNEDATRALQELLPQRYGY